MTPRLKERIRWMLAVMEMQEYRRNGRFRVDYAALQNSLVSMDRYTYTPQHVYPHNALVSEKSIVDMLYPRWG